jgi:transaldolase
LRAADWRRPAVARGGPPRCRGDHQTDYLASALSKGDRYNDQLAELAALGADVDTAVFTVTTQDVRAACDVLAPVYARTDGLDGCVSIEVDPWLSRDAAANR